MENKDFEKELIRALSLINFDSSKTILEQTSNLNIGSYGSKPWEKSDRLGPNGDFQPLKKATPPKVTAETIYWGLKNQIDSWGTNDKTVIGYVEDIDSTNYVPLLKLVMDNENQVSIMDWIMTDYTSVSERNAEEGEPELFSIGGFGASFNWWVNDETVTKIGSMLSKFSYLNTGEGEYDTYEAGEVDLGSDGLQGTASKEQLASIAHVVLPIAAVAITLFTGGLGGVIAGAMVELGDAAIYEFVDHDHYAAGLALIFAFAGPLDEIVGLFGKTVGKKILFKLMKKQVLSESEQTALRYIARNEARLAKLTRLGMARQVIKTFILKAKDASKIVKFIFWMANKGFLISKFTSKMGLIIGGSFLTWDAIAEKLGLCNSVQLSELQKTDYKILQLIGTAGPYLQPYTKGCKTDKGEEIIKNAEKTLMTMNQRIIDFLTAAINTNTVLSIHFEKNKMYEVVLLQYVLRHFGFSSLPFNQEKFDKSIGKGEKWSKEKCKAEMEKTLLYGTDIYKASEIEKSHPECKGWEKQNTTKKIDKLNNSNFKSYDKVWKVDSSGNVVLTNPPKKDNDIFGSDPNDYGSNFDFNWGYYDKMTKSNVEDFQKKYLGSSSADGVAGKTVFEKMLSLVNSLGDSQIKNYSNLNWDPKEIEKLRQKVIEDIKKDMTEEEKATVNITPEEAKKSIQEQKDAIVKSLNKANNNIEFDENDLKLINSAVVSDTIK